MTEVEYGAWEPSRHVARKYARQADQAAASAQAASVRGNKAQVIKFARLVTRYSRCRDNHNRTAAELILRFHNNRLDDETIIDLHYLRASEAVNALLERIEALVTNGQSNLDVIVGRGLHSMDGPKIRPTVISLVKHCSIPYKISTTNLGLIHLFLPDNLLETMNVVTTFYFDPEHPEESVKDRRKPVTLDQFLVVKKHRKGRKSGTSSISEINREECSSGSTSKTEKSRRRRSRKKKTKTDSVTISPPEPPCHQVLSLVEPESSSVAGMDLKHVSTSVDERNESEHCNQSAMIKRFTIVGRFAALLFILFFILFVLIYSDVLQPEYKSAKYGLDMMGCYSEVTHPNNLNFLDGMLECTKYVRKG